MGLLDDVGDTFEKVGKIVTPATATIHDVARNKNKDKYKRMLNVALPVSSGMNQVWRGDQEGISNLNKSHDSAWGASAAGDLEIAARAVRKYVNPDDPTYDTTPSASEVKFQQDEAARRRKALAGRSMLRSNSSLGSSGVGSTSNLGGV